MNTRPGFAVVVGIGSYPDKRVQQLPHAKADADAMAEVLKDSGFCGFPEDQVRLLVDERATRDRIVHNLSKWLPEASKGADLAVFFFAGHGMIRMPGSSQEKGFLMPFNADPEDLATHGISMNDVAEWIRGIEARDVLVCLDCCHAGMAIPRGGGPMGRGIKISPAAYQEMSGKGRHILAACDDGQQSMECPELGHGLFTYHLLRGIRGEGDLDRDGVVGVSELFEHVYEKVETEARARFNVVQTPWRSSSGSGGVYISRCPVRIEDKEAPAREERPSAGVSTADIREIERSLPDADDESAIRMLVQLARSEHCEAVPLILRSLTHKSPEVRQTAGRAVRQVGWQRVTDAMGSLVAEGRDKDIDVALDGLAAFEAHHEIVALLERCVPMLHGNLRNQGLQILERKRLSLNQETVAAHFERMGTQYNVEKALGQGPLTATYKAYRRDLDLTQVLRVLRPEFLGHPDVVARFLDLGRQSTKYVHQNLVLTRDVQTHPKERIHFIARDFIDGTTLQKLFAVGERISAGKTIRIIRRLLEALQSLHRDREVHGSVKPSNVFITSQDRVILGDRGIPLQECPVAVDRMGYDFQYAAPEVCTGEVRPGAAADFYSVGCVAYQLLCGRPPFVSSNAFKLAGLHANKEITPPSRAGSSVADAGDAFMMRLLAKDPAERFSTTEEALAGLRDLEAAMSGEATRPMSEEQLIKRSFLTRFQDSVLSVGPLSKELEAPESETGVPHAPVHLGQLTEQPEELTRRGYRVTGEIGRGGMGVIYKATQDALDRVVAIKVLSRVTGDRLAGIMARFKREAKVLAQLSHPHILPIFDFFADEGTVYLVMPFCPGGTLSDRIRTDAEWADVSTFVVPSAAERFGAELAGEDVQAKAATEPLTPCEVMRIGVSIARALEHAHTRGILHRDVKPNNILFDSSMVAQLCDFGLAAWKDDGDDTLTQAGDVFGTPAYMSPEQLSSHAVRLTGATDVWSLGCSLYEGIMRRRPFGAATREGLYSAILMSEPDLRMRSQGADVPRGLEKLLKGMLQKEARKRPSARETADKLEVLIGRHCPEAE